MRLDKLLLLAGYGSRKQIKRVIVTKQVTVNGRIILQDNYNVDPKLEEVKVGEKLINLQPHVYYMLNKPQGVVSAVKDKEHQTVIDLIAPIDQKDGLFPVGRLDRDTEGLLLITNNGKLGHELLVPHKSVIKRYEVIVNEKVVEEDVQAFQKGIVFLDGTICQPAKLTILDSQENESKVWLDITEGKFHQVKKMFLSVGKKVIYLKRLSMGSLILDEKLTIGEYRPLSLEELKELQQYFNPKL